MKKAAPMSRSISRLWTMVTLAFAALLFGALTVDWDRAEAQQKKAKAKQPFESKKAGYEPKARNTPVAKSLTNGQKIDAAALTKLINQEITKRLNAENVKAAGQCSDEEFIRRVYLDLVGVIPTREKVTAFLADKSTDRRAKLVDELLDNSRFGHYIAETWVNHMVPRESNNRALQQKPLENWLSENFNKNTPLNKLIYDLLTTTGEIDKNPAGTYFVANPTVDKITDNVSRMFLGVQLQCAQCHNHPFTDWKQTEYWAMAAFFMNTRVNGNPQQAAKKGIVLAVNETNKAPNKKNALPESAKIVPARFLQGEQPTIAGIERRPTFAKWATSPDNKFFARAMVNRFWYQLMGRGLVNPVDDMHDDNAATHPELLATLTEQFKLNGFDTKYLIRAICNSEVYQRSSATKDDAGTIDLDLYSRREVRVLMPEQLFDSLTTILGTANAKVETKDKGAKKGPQTPRDNFVNFFRVDEANPLEYQNGIPQALRMMNSPFTAKSDVTAGQITAGAKTPAEAIERIYLTTLARRPSQNETERLTNYVNRPGANARTAYGDILWALMNSSEFVLNH
jgi:Protein of unknown function (DUF1549)/Protein of unknown function (DUF1553)